MNTLGSVKFSDRQDPLEIRSPKRIQDPEMTKLQIVGSSLSPLPIRIQKLSYSWNRGNAHDPNWMMLFFDDHGVRRLWDQSKHGGHTELVDEGGCHDNQ